MGQRFDAEDLARFDCAMVLDRFGWARLEARSPCPFCKTSPGSTAFSFKGHLYICYACGKRGNSVGLYADLAGIPYGRAAAEIASHLGLIESSPAEWDAKRRARELAHEAETEAAEIARARWEGRQARLERLRAIARAMRGSDPGPLALDVLGNLYLEIGRLEAWDEQTTPPPIPWTPDERAMLKGFETWLAAATPTADPATPYASRLHD